jgi:hypothetical protein
METNTLRLLFYKNVFAGKGTKWERNTECTGNRATFNEAGTQKSFVVMYTGT